MLVVEAQGVVDVVIPIKVAYIVVGTVISDDDPGPRSVLDCVVTAGFQGRPFFVRVIEGAVVVTGTIGGINQGGVLVAVGDVVVRGGRFGQAATAVVGHFGIAGLTALGRHEDDTRGGFRTVDSAGGSVFQDGNGLHILRVEVLEVHPRDTVDQHQRGTAVDRSNATDVDGHPVYRVTGGHIDVEGGVHTLQHMGHTGRRPVLQFVAGNGGHRTRNVDTLLGGVTDDYGIIQPLLNGGQGNLEGIFRRGDDDFQVPVSKGGNDQFLSGGTLNLEIAVKAGRRGFPVDAVDDIGADDGLRGCGIQHDAVYQALLCRQGEYGAEQYKQREKYRFFHRCRYLTK